MVLLSMTASLTSFSQDERTVDSVSKGRELVIFTSSASIPDSGALTGLKSGRKVLDTPAIETELSKPEIKTSGLAELHPMAIGFVKDYLDDHTNRLEKMKTWGDPYFRMIDNILAKYNLPAELKYLAVIESDLKSNAVSWAGAVGPWQFMPETGRLMGLRINRYTDERRDLYKSTHAAARYLKDLYRELGDWLLVIAAYNGGSARVYSAIRKSGSRDFWKLQYYLPAESRNHVKKFIATHFIMEGQGGVTTQTAGAMNQTDSRIDSALTAGTETREISGKYHSAVVTKTIGMDILEFNRLNPGFDSRVGATGYLLRLPSDKMQLFAASRAQILNESVLFLMTNGEDEKKSYPDQIRIPQGKVTHNKTSRTK